MSSRAKSRGSGSGCFIRFLGLIVLGYLLISWLPRCAQEVPQMAANTVSHAASGATSGAVNAASGAADAAGSAMSNAGRSLMDHLESLWGGETPADKFKLVCEQMPVEGVDKVCPYFTAAMDGATELQAAQTSCYLAAAGSGTAGPQNLRHIYQTCPLATGNLTGFQGCVESYVTQTVDPSEWSSCMASSQGMFEQEVHTISEPIACIPGLPKAWCTTSAPATGAPGSSPAMRTDANYTNCLQNYYLSPGVKAVVGTSCGSQVNAGNAGCVQGVLQAFTYQGQNLGQQYIAYCAAQPQ